MNIVTAVIPCYNAAAFLAKALASVRAQTPPVAAILVIDDGSDDGSVAIARQAGAQVLSTGGQLGPATARNLGVQHAATRYIAFLDADDVWLPDHCATLVQLLEASPAAAVAFGRVQRFSESGDIPMLPPKAHVSGERPLPELLGDNPIAQSAAIVRRTMFLQVGGYQDGMRYSEDYDLWLRLGERFPFVASNRVTCRYRVHPGQASHRLLELLRCCWEARFACRARLSAGRANRREDELVLLSALENDIESAWSDGETDALNFLLSVASQIDGASRLAGVLRSRLRRVWLRRLALRVKRVAGLARPARDTAG